MEKKLAVITGASRGIGHGVALYLARKGYHVALLARTEPDLLALQNTINKSSPCTSSSIHTVDITNEAQIKSTIGTIISDYGNIDVLFNNAGIAIRGTSELAATDFRQLLDVNLLGAFYLIQQVVPQMKIQQSGYIFNVCSTAAEKADPIMGGYGASKAALLRFNDSLFDELLPHGIKVTALCPNLVNTYMARRVTSIKAGDMLQPEDIAATVDFLLQQGKHICIKEISMICRAQAIKQTFG